MGYIMISTIYKCNLLVLFSFGMDVKKDKVMITFCSLLLTDHSKFIAVGVDRQLVIKQTAPKTYRCLADKVVFVPLPLITSAFSSIQIGHNMFYVVADKLDVKYQSGNTIFKMFWFWTTDIITYSSPRWGNKFCHKYADIHEQSICPDEIPRLTFPLHSNASIIIHVLYVRSGHTLQSRLLCLLFTMWLCVTVTYVNAWSHQ